MARHNKIVEAISGNWTLLQWKVVVNNMKWQTNTKLLGYKKYVCTWLLIYIGLHCINRSLWSATTLATLMQSDNVTFYASKIMKGTSGFNLKKTNFFTCWPQHPKNSWNIFQIQISPLLWLPQDPQGCLEKQNHPLSSNLVVWCTKIGPKTKKP